MCEPVATNPLQNQFDMTALLNSALKDAMAMGCAGYMLNSLPTTSLQSGDEPSSPTGSQGSSQGRKRRRAEVPNPANTLDGLVARRAEDGQEELGSRFMTENEAIESPDDQTELRRMETDPDVSTRTCSICGYQGKWVSEMIRHKRVHTADRPFKCRYCSRTSKWKADLIRHVAKTHGIRVVSKYSRSKTFDTSASLRPRHQEEKPRVFGCEADEYMEGSRQGSLSPLPALPRPEPLSPPRRPSQLYRCRHCLFEHEALSVFVGHLRQSHSVAAFGCPCGLHFESLDAAQQHLAQQSLPQEHISANFTVCYKENNSALNTLSPSSRSDCSVDSGVHTDTEDSEVEMRNEFQDAGRGADRVRLALPVPLLPSLPLRCAPNPLAVPPMSPLLSALAALPSAFAAPFSPLSPTLDLTTILLALQAQASSQAQTVSPVNLLSPQSAFTPTGALRESRQHSAGQSLPENNESARCSLCEAVFSSPSSLPIHLRFHGSGLAHACSMCNYAAATEINLHRHVATHHKTAASDVLVSLAELPEEDSEEEALNVEE